MRRQRNLAQREPLATLRGELVSFSRKSADGWGVGKLRVADADELVTIVGKILDTREGDTVELSGRYVTHQQWGEQFKIEGCIAQRAESAEGVVRWLASTLPGIGDKRAHGLIAHFGGVQQLWQVIETDAGRLAEVDGITPDRAQAIHAAYVEHSATRDNMICLRGWGLTNNQIQHCLDAWQTLDEVVHQVRCNPYLLARHVHGFGFARADEVAKLAGMKHNAPERIEAGIVHVLQEAAIAGSCWLWGGALQRIAADELLKVSFDEVAQGILSAARMGLILRRGKRIYSARMETIEAKAASGALRLLMGDAAARYAPANDNGQTLH